MKHNKEIEMFYPPPIKTLEERLTSTTHNPTLRTTSNPLKGLHSIKRNNQQARYKPFSNWHIQDSLKSLAANNLPLNDSVDSYEQDH